MLGDLFASIFGAAFWTALFNLFVELFTGVSVTP